MKDLAGGGGGSGGAGGGGWGWRRKSAFFFEDIAVPGSGAMHVSIKPLLVFFIPTLPFGYMALFFQKRARN